MTNLEKVRIIAEKLKEINEIIDTMERTFCSVDARWLVMQYVEPAEGEDVFREIVETNNGKLTVFESEGNYHAHFYSDGIDHIALMTELPEWVEKLIK